MQEKPRKPAKKNFDFQPYTKTRSRKESILNPTLFARKAVARGAEILGK